MFMIDCRDEYYKERAIEIFNNAFKETEKYLGLPVNLHTINSVKSVWNSMILEMHYIGAKIIYEDEIKSFEVESFEITTNESVVNIIPIRYKN